MKIFVRSHVSVNMKKGDKYFYVIEFNNETSTLHRFTHNDEDFLNRVADSVQTAFYEGNGECLVYVEKNENKYES